MQIQLLNASTYVYSLVLLHVRCTALFFSWPYEMHRRVAHTVAAVIPRTYSTERSARLHDPARVIDEETNYYGTDDVYLPRQENSDFSGYDFTTHEDNDQQHWRRLDSRGESILSGLEGSGGEVYDRMTRSPESMLRTGSLDRVVEEFTDPPAPTDPVSPQLEPEEVEEVLEWELEQSGLYGGEYRLLLYVLPALR
jgi:hypothetical protein